jgi:N,N'-diacetylchitobiose transport system permease protein
MLLPAVAVLVAVLAYPLGRLGLVSFQQYNLRELIAGRGTWIGLDNYTAILGDKVFWTVVLRTAAFTAVNVGLTMGLGLLIALLMRRLGRTMKFLVTLSLISAWAMPAIVAVAIWQWMVDFEFGVFNWLLTTLHLGDFEHHNWFVNPWQGWAVITAVVVWGAIPFVAITLYAALTQVPQELEEAARCDGANALQIFRNVTVPVIKPVLVILTSLSTIWDFQVFTQVYVMLGGRADEDYWVMGVYSYIQAFGTGHYGMGAAISVVLVLMLLSVTFFYIRQMLRIGDVK